MNLSPYTWAAVVAAVVGIILFVVHTVAPDGAFLPAAFLVLCAVGMGVIANSVISYVAGGEEKMDGTADQPAEEGTGEDGLKDDLVLDPGVPAPTVESDPKSDPEVPAPTVESDAEVTTRTNLPNELVSAEASAMDEEGDPDVVSPGPPTSRPRRAQPRDRFFRRPGVGREDRAPRPLVFDIPL